MTNERLSLFCELGANFTLTYKCESTFTSNKTFLNPQCQFAFNQHTVKNRKDSCYSSDITPQTPSLALNFNTANTIKNSLKVSWQIFQFAVLEYKNLRLGYPR